jgi:4-diphosphocytidyl-2-C-methyl-D-erythritol kinase
MLTLISPAKINLFLHIIGKRPDGYHNLASLFQAISLHDTIHFSLADHDELSCDCPDIPTGPSNLIFKAANLFRNKTGLKFGLKVHLEKRIPHEAGLGGGSSNAATTLWALNALHQFPVSLEELIAWSSEIGSDITFFLSNGTALCTGRGEIVQELKPLPEMKVWIAKPDEGLSTPAVFKALDLYSGLEKKDSHLVVDLFYQRKAVCFNDLEEAAFKIKPGLHAFKRQLESCGFEQVMMTGSGTAFFCMGTPMKMPSTIQLIPVKFLNRAVDSWYGFS